MKILNLSLTMMLVLAGLILIGILIPANAQKITIEQIQNNLLINTPNSGNPNEREEMIMALDSILKNNSSPTSQNVYDFYSFMMTKVNEELKEDVSGGAAIWIMYNHGFVIKTSQIVIAFDLVNGYHGWTSNLSAELIKQINILFISHEHGDHYDNSVAETVKANGGYVVCPSEEKYIGNLPMEVGESLAILGLDIKAHYSLHSVPSRIYEVTCPNGLKFLHTGDNQTSISLPEINDLDVLLLNAWVNESGSASAVVGMRNCIGKLNPTVMIPGHIQELNHEYVPDNPRSRVPYEWAFEVDDEPITAEVQVMAWGERYFVTEEFASPSIIFDKYRIYPNPTNDLLTIETYNSNHYSIEITSVNGQYINSLEMEGPSLQIDLFTFQQGAYLITIRSKDFVTTEKIIKL